MLKKLAEISALVLESIFVKIGGGGNCNKDASLAYKRHTTPYTGAVQAERSTHGDGETYLSITAVVSPLQLSCKTFY